VEPGVVLDGAAVAQAPVAVVDEPGDGPFHRGAPAAVLGLPAGVGGGLVAGGCPEVVVGSDSGAVVMGLACVDADPDRGHVVPLCGVLRVSPTDDLAVDSLRSDHSQFLIGSRVVVGHRAANQ